MNPNPTGLGGRSTVFRRVARRCLLALALGWLAAPPPALAEGGVLGAAEAFALARAGKLTIVDVRTRQEWTQTGVPQAALEVSLFPEWGVRNADFVDDVLAAVGRDKSTPIALICARGNRSSFAQGLLEKQGFATVYSISEGMAGSSFGPGWLARGLPLEPCTNC